jgi:hypothetical protein
MKDWDEWKIIQSKVSGRRVIPGDKDSTEHGKSIKCVWGSEKTAARKTTKKLWADNHCDPPIGESEGHGSSRPEN